MTNNSSVDVECTWFYFRADRLRAGFWRKTRRKFRNNGSAHDRNWHFRDLTRCPTWAPIRTKADVRQQHEFYGIMPPQTLRLMRNRSRRG